MKKHELGKAALALVGTATFLLPATWAPAASAWELISSDTARVFVPDAYQGRKAANSAVATRYVDGGTKREDGAKQLVGKTPCEVRTDLKNPSKELLSNGIYSVYKLVRSDKWNDAQYRTPWTLYNMKQKQAQTTTLYNFEWLDTVTNQIRREPDPKLEVSDWVNQGAPERDTVAGTGADLWDYMVKEDARSDQQEVLLSRVPLSMASNEAAKAKSALFLSDSGHGNGATSVAGSQKRTAFKADEAIVSETKNPTSAGTGVGDVNLPGSGNTLSLPKATPAPVVVDNKGFSMEDWIGTWTSKGKSGNPYDYQIVVQKHSNKNIKYTFDSWFKADAFDTLPPTDFSMNGAFADDKKTAYYDSQGTVNCNLKMIRENGQLRLAGTVTLRQIDWYGKVTGSKTYSVNLTK